MSIKDLRERNGFDQSELAARLNISRSTLSHYETGRRKLDAETAKKLADIFEVSLDEIYGYTPKGDAFDGEDFSKQFFAAYGDQNAQFSEAQMRDIAKYARWVKEQEREK